MHDIACDPPTGGRGPSLTHRFIKTPANICIVSQPMAAAAEGG